MVVLQALRGLTTLESSVKATCHRAGTTADLDGLLGLYKADHAMLMVPHSSVLLP